MARILTFQVPLPDTGSGPYEDDSRVFTPEAMDEFDAERRLSAVDALAA